MILNGARTDDEYGKLARRALDAELAGRDFGRTWYDLADCKIAPCKGDFFCWVRSPGMCMNDDINREIARGMIQSDLLVLFTPITFGGYSSELKKAVDHLIQNILPFFSQVDGEVHHEKRYARYPDLLAIGWLPQPDAEEEQVFRALVHRNSLNFYPPSHVCGTLNAQLDEEQIRLQIRGLLESLHAGGDHDAPALEDQPETALQSIAPSSPRNALLLVGSPRSSKSTSAALGSYVMESLSAAGLQTSTLHVASCLRSEEETRNLVTSALEADLVTVAFPLYVDSLPAPLIHALELIARARSRAQASKPQLLAVIVNCGFPEAAHNRIAVAICRQFARQTGFGWAGGMLLGGGEGVVNGTPLKELGGRAKPMTLALDIAARALQRGEAIPREATLAFARSILPTWLYMLIGSLGWRMMARRYQKGRALHAQPYAP